MILAKISNKSRELFRYREMFFGLVSREVRARYKGSVLGFVWSLLNPMMMLGIYSLIFSVYMRINVPNYPLFLFCGLLPWAWFTTSINNATSTIVSNGSLIKKVYFPHEILPMVNISTNLVNFLLSLPVLLAFMLFTQASFSVNLLFFPLLIAVQFLFTLGLSLILCTLNAFFRDVEQLLGPLLTVWFYMTPVVYPATTIPEKFRWILYLNPMAPIIQGYQAIFFHGQAPSLPMLAYCLVLGAVLFLVGYTVFYAQKFRFAEVV